MGFSQTPAVNSGRAGGSTGRALVSVCVTLFDPCEPFLVEQAAGLARNQGNLLEVVLSDDTSGGVGARVVEIYRAQLDECVPVRYVRHPPPADMISNWNFAIEQCVAPWVINLGQDDVVEDGCLATCLRTVARFPEASFVAFGSDRVDAHGGPVTRGRRVNDTEHLYEPQGVYWIDLRLGTALCLRNGQVIGEPSRVLMRRDLVGRVGGYSSAYSHAADIDLLLRLLRLAPGVFICVNLGKRRVHGANATYWHVRNGIAARDRELLFREWAGSGTFSASEVARFTSSLAWHSAYDCVSRLAEGGWMASCAAAWRAITYAARTTPKALLEPAIELAQNRNRDMELVRGSAVGALTGHHAGENVSLRSTRPAHVRACSS